MAQYSYALAVPQDQLPQLQASLQYSPPTMQLVSLAMYGEPGAPMYAYIAQEPLVRPWHIETGITSTLDFVTRSTYWAAQGYYPTMVTGTGSNSTASLETFSLAVVYEHGAPKGAYLGGPVRWNDFAPPGDEITSKILVSFDGFGVRSHGDADPSAIVRRMWFVGLYRPQPQSFIAWNLLRSTDVHVSSGLGGLLESEHHQAVLKGWARGEHSVPDRWNTDDEIRRPVTTIYRTDVYEPWPDDLRNYSQGGSPIYGPTGSAGVDEMVRFADNELGWWPHRIGANGPADDPRFCITLVKKWMKAPKVRYFHVVDAADQNPPTHVTVPTPNPPVPSQVGGAGNSGIGVFTEPKPNPGSSGGGTSAMPRPPRWEPSPFPGAPRVRSDLMVVDAASVTAQFVPVPHNPFPHGDDIDPSNQEGLGPAPEDSPPTLAFLIGQIDQILRNVSDRSGARSLQLFIAQDGRGVLSRAYTNAEYNFMMTQVHHKFRSAASPRA